MLAQKSESFKKIEKGDPTICCKWRRRQQRWRWAPALGGWRLGVSPWELLSVHTHTCTHTNTHIHKVKNTHNLNAFEILWLKCTRYHRSLQWTTKLFLDRKRKWDLNLVIYPILKQAVRGVKESGRAQFENCVRNFVWMILPQTTFKLLQDKCLFFFPSFCAAIYLTWLNCDPKVCQPAFSTTTSAHNEFGNDKQVLKV